MNQPIRKSLDELSFSDLCIEQDEQNFPHLSEIFGQLVAKLRFRKTRPHTNNEDRDSRYHMIDRFNLTPVHKLRPRH